MQNRNLQFFFSRGALFACSLLTFQFASSPHLPAQELQTKATNQVQIFGDWDPPTPSAISNQTDLFPGNVPQTSRDRSGSSSYPLHPSQPKALSDQPPRARPLQPLKQDNILLGTFETEAARGAGNAQVNHHEASTADAALPLPSVNAAADLDDWSTQEHESNTPSQSMIGSIQSGVSDLLGNFQSEGSWSEKISGFFGGGGDRFKRVFGSLAIVIGGYLGFVWLMRRFNPASNRGIPSEVIEVIGTAPLAPKKSLQLVRLGSKLLLLMNSLEGTHPVGEVTDPDEVEYLISLCKGKRSRITPSVASVVRRIKDRGTSSVAAASQIQTTSPVAPPSSPESMFSTAQLVQALQSIQNSGQQNSILKA